MQNTVSLKHLLKKYPSVFFFLLEEEEEKEGVSQNHRR